MARGKTYERAQVNEWVDSGHFAVGRWDGGLDIFRPPSTGDYGPVMTQTVMLPSRQPAEMIGRIREGLFATSNDAQSLAVWRRLIPTGYELASTPSFDARAGMANSAAAVADDAGSGWLATGHANGFVVLWRVNGDDVVPTRVIDVRSPSPIPSPYPLKNVRGVAFSDDKTLVTGSEDGDVCIIDVPSGAVQRCERYNPDAQRGINAISARGGYLVIANCSVGSTDKNLWLYKIDNKQLRPLDAINLVKDSSRSQVFNFSVSLISTGNALGFVSSTEEGLLWLGRVQSDKLISSDSASVAPDGGAAIAVEHASGLISAVAFDVAIFSVAPN